MKSNSRKKLVVSSVAMLSVATLALGTATYAWFTSSTSATADKISVSTTKSSELKISKVDLDWKDSFSYNINNVLRPTTSANGLSWFANVAADKSAFTAASDTYTEVTSSNKVNYVVDEMFNIKNAGGQTASGVKITLTSSVDSAFARIAVVPCDDPQTDKNVPAAITAENFKANIYGSKKDDAWKPYNGTALETSDYKTADTAASKVITVGDMEKDAVKSYRVLVWFEGEDADCYDTTESGLTVPSISLTVDAKTSQD